MSHQWDTQLLLEGVTFHVTPRNVSIDPEDPEPEEFELESQAVYEGDGQGNGGTWYLCSLKTAVSGKEVKPRDTAEVLTFLKAHPDRGSTIYCRRGPKSKTFRVYKEQKLGEEEKRDDEANASTPSLGPSTASKSENKSKRKAEFTEQVASLKAELEAKDEKIAALEKELAEFKKTPRNELTVSQENKVQNKSNTTSQFYAVAPHSFVTVSELIHYVGKFLDRKRDVLSAASVSIKWREALLWEEYSGSSGSTTIGCRTEFRRRLDAQKSLPYFTTIVRNWWTTHGIPLKAGGLYEIQPRHAPRMRIDVSGAQTSNGSRIHQWDMRPSKTVRQKFKAHLVDGGYFVFEPLHAPGKAIDNRGISMKGCQLWDHSGLSNQNAHWRLEACGRSQADDDYYHVFSRNDQGGHRWDIAGGGRNMGPELLTWSNDGGDMPHRQFKFLPTRPGHFTDEGRAALDDIFDSSDDEF